MRGNRSRKDPPRRAVDAIPAAEPPADHQPRYWRPPRPHALTPPPLPRPHWVDTERAILHLEDELRTSRALIGIDIETTLAGQHFCELALLQLSDGYDVWLVDPLAVDVGPLLRILFSTPALPPIFHDASGDLTVIKRLHHCLPTAILDTLLASQALGIFSPNLGNLSRDVLGWVLDKGTQQSNWLRRPLTPAQLEYAAADAFVLPHLEHDLANHLYDMGVERGYEDACLSLLERLRAYRAPDSHPYELRFWRRYRNEAALIRLRRLLHWRTAEANRGRIDVLMGFGNETLARIALEAPRTLRDLSGRAGLPRHLCERYGQRVLDVTAGATA